VYFDLDLAPGGLQQGGLWGGFGIVLPHVPRNTTVYLPTRIEQRELIRWTDQVAHLPRFVRRLVLKYAERRSTRR